MPSISTQTFNNNNIKYKSPVLLSSISNQSTTTTKFKELKDIVSIKHSNAIVTDATHTNICAYNDFVIKGNLFIGDTLLTPKTISIDVDMNVDTTVPLHLDGNNGNILFHINSRNQNNNINLEIANAHNKQHGFIIFHNTSDYMICINFLKVISNPTLHTTLDLDSKCVMYVSYIIVNGKLIIRRPQNRKTAHIIEKHNINKNDMENVIFQNINKIKLDAIDDNQYLTANINGTAQWAQNQTESEICTIYNSTSSSIISLNNIQSTHINININNINHDIYRIQSFTDKKVGEGTINIRANNISSSTIIQLKFLEGFIIDSNASFYLKLGSENLKLWYNHINTGYTILRTY